MSIRILAAAVVAAMLAVPGHAADTATRQTGAVYQSPLRHAAAAAAPMHVSRVAPSRSVDLAAPSEAERAGFAELNRNRGAKSSSFGRPRFIGFGRDIDVAERRIDLGELAWTALAGGERVARIEVASATAAGVRVALRLASPLEGVTFRFASAAAASARESVTADTIARATARYGEFWSPVIDGDRAAIEIEASPEASLAGAVLELARVSHLVVGPAASAADAAKRLQDIGRSGSCNVNVKCVQPQDDALVHQAASTGKLVFTLPAGGTALCTGTLLNDTGTTFTPYLYSASHCFESAYEAANLNVWWFFDAAACGTPTTPGAYQVQTGGAALLGRSQDWDWALLRLNALPPDGSYFSGWDAATLGSGSTAEVFHHPAGDLKKWSQGTTFGAVPVDFADPAGGPGTFTRVVYSLGTTEGGSSGAGLVTFDGANYFLRGGLLGGDALCSNPDGSDYYSQFGAALPLIAQYVAPASVTPDDAVVVEYHNLVNDHYFMTASPIEIGSLDRGEFPGWERTGFAFRAYFGPGPGRSPVCRYYQRDNRTHFYSADPAQCAVMPILFPDWILESNNVFYIGLPDQVSGACPAGTRPVYRFFRPAVVNHRFPAEQTVAQSLTGKPGWIAEGYGPGPLYPAMCSPTGL